MNSKLPPLNWLRAFEAAARHLNLTHAAEELHFTQAAVSKQIRNLEARLGADLFVRTTSGLELTPSGAAYLPTVQQSIRSLEAVTDDLFGADSRPRVNLRTSLVFFLCWLAPRIKDFYITHPDIDLRILSNVWVNDGDIEAGADLEIRYGRGSWPSLISHRLTQDELIPVAGPQLFSNLPLDEVSDFSKHTLLHVIGYEEGWSHWFDAHSIGERPKSAGYQFDTLLSAFELAEQGLGLALGRTSLVAHSIQAGKLIAPLNMSLAVEEGFFLVQPTDMVVSSAQKVFIDWLQQEAQST